MMGIQRSNGDGADRALTPRPDRSFDEGLQHERTALAWERTAVATMVAGALLARWAAEDAAPLFGLLGIVQVAFGGGLLAWTGRHYEDLHGPLRAGDSPVHPVAVRVVGVATTVSIGVALAFATVVILADRA